LDFRTGSSVVNDVLVASPALMIFNGQLLAMTEAERGGVRVKKLSMPRCATLADKGVDGEW
jgi:hypothetical protein